MTETKPENGKLKTTLDFSLTLDERAALANLYNGARHGDTTPAAVMRREKMFRKLCGNGRELRELIREATTNPNGWSGPLQLSDDEAEGLQQFTRALLNENQPHALAVKLVAWNDTLERLLRGDRAEVARA